MSLLLTIMGGWRRFVWICGWIGLGWIWGTKCESRVKGGSCMLRKPLNDHLHLTIVLSANTQAITDDRQ